MIIGLFLLAFLPGASYTGSVRSAGQPIPGATVTAVQGANRIAVLTDEAGHYTLPDLPTGVWQFTVEMFGFAPTQRQVTVAEGPGSVDFNLELRTRPRAATQTRPGDGGGPGGRRGFQNLSLNGANNVESQVAAALSAQPSADASAGAGSSANANEAFLVNGSLSQGLQAPQQEDALEARRAAFAQRMGQGGQVAGQPGFGGGGGVGGGGFGGGGGGFRGGGGGRGGGGFGGGGFGGRGGRGGPGMGANPNFGNRRRQAQDSIRGALFFSVGNSEVNARPYSLTGQPVEQPSYGQSRFGVVAGGGLKIPKVLTTQHTFFFLSYFGTRSKSPASYTSTLPTPLERAGDFSQSGTAPLQVFDPTSRLPFPGNRIPESQMNPAAAGLLRFIPLPNQPGQVQNYQYVTAVPQNTDNLGVRLNQTINRSNRLNFNFNLQNRDSHGAQLYGFNDEISGRGISSTVGYTHNFSPRTLTNVRFTFSRNRSTTLPYFAYGEDVAAELGIHGVSQSPINYGPPNLSFTNFGGLTDTSPVLTRNQTTGIGDGFTLVRGSHTITFGGDFRRLQLNTQTDQNARGTFSFSGLLTSAFDANGQPLPNTGYDFADFLLGLPQSSSVRFGSSDTYFRGSSYDAYVNDDWRVLPNLTVNAGLRYEYFTPYSEKYNKIANLDIAPGFTAVAVVTPGGVGPYSGKFSSALVNPDRNNFSPRVGIAWKPFPKHQFLVRAGYGIFYNGSIYNQFPSRLASQPPFAETATLTTSLTQQLTLQNGFATAPTQTITNTYAVDRYYRAGYAQTWNFPTDAAPCRGGGSGLPGHEGHGSGHPDHAEPRRARFATYGRRAEADRQCGGLSAGHVERQFDLSCHANPRDAAVPAGCFDECLIYVLQVDRQCIDDRRRRSGGGAGRSESARRAGPVHFRPAPHATG